MECPASSWPYTVSDTECVKEKGHDGPHVDEDGFEWGDEE